MIKLETLGYLIPEDDFRETMIEDMRPERTGWIFLSLTTHADDEHGIIYHLVYGRVVND